MWLSRFIQLYRLRMKRPDLIIEITTQCNQDCDYCPRSQMIEKQLIRVGNLEEKGFMHIICEMETVHPNKIVLGGFGEPTLHPNLIQYIRMLKKSFPRVELVTNATTLTKDLSKQLIDIQLDDLQISYNRVQTDNIASFLKLKGNNKPDTRIQVLNTSDQQTFLLSCRWLLNNNDMLQYGLLHNWGVFLDDIPSLPTIRHPCPQLWFRHAIDKEGNVYPCCISQAEGAESTMCLGNLFKESLQSILSGDKLTTIRALHKHSRWDELELCRECSMWSSGKNRFVKILNRWM